MKKLIIPIAIFCMALASCSEKAPSMHTDFEYTIEDIENDPNWVEITDVEEYIQNACLTPPENKVLSTGGNYTGLIIKNEAKYKETWERERNLRLKQSEENIKQDSSYFPCVYTYNTPLIDFTNRDMICFYASTGGATNWERKIFINEVEKKLLYLVFCKRRVYLLVQDAFIEIVSIPKLGNDYTIKFDLSVKDSVKHDED